MTESYRKVRERLCREFDEIAAKPDMSIGDLEMLHKLTDTIKNIDKIEMLEEEGGSSYGGDWEARGSYGNMGGQGGQSYRNQKRDGRGRYSNAGNTGGGSNQGGGSYRNGVSYGEESGVHELLEDAMEMATSERERSAIRRAIEDIRK